MVRDQLGRGVGEGVVAGVDGSPFCCFLAWSHFADGLLVAARWQHRDEAREIQSYGNELSPLVATVELALDEQLAE